MKLARSTIFVCFNYSTRLSNDDFSSFKNSTKEARLLRNGIKIKMSQLIVQIYKLLHTPLTTKARVVKVRHNLLHSVSQVNQSKTLPLIFLTGILFVAQCTLVKSG